MSSHYLRLAAAAISLSHFGVSALPAADTTTTNVTPSSTWAVEPFPYETTVLTDVDIEDYPEFKFDDNIYTDESSINTVDRRASPLKQCKVIPSDSAWPSKTIWAIMNTLTGKGLIKTVPLAAPCYNGVYYNATRCAEITASWTDSDLHDQDPTSIMSPFFQGLSCLPTSDPTGSCTLGGYPNYVVKATSVLDVQVAVNFARNFNLRLVVKNTGHDFSGKSSGSNSLSVWTHNFKDIKYYPKYKDNGYSGPAFKIGSGVQGREIYEAAYKEGLMVVGGEGMTVGYGGGYLQGGGHSPLSSLLGMGADHVLEFEVVTSDGRFVTANPTQNPDLFWALRGGGGSTFGIVTSVVVKAYKDIPVTTVTFSFTSSSPDSFWAAVQVYFSSFVTMSNAGIYSYFNVFGNTFNMAPLFCPNLTKSSIEPLLAPLFSKLDELNIPYTPVYTEHPSFYPAWSATFPKEGVGLTNLQTASRLFPRQNWKTDQSFNTTFAAIRSVIEAQGMLIGFNMKNEYPPSGNPNNAVNPAWRESVFHGIVGTSWAPDATAEEIQSARDELTNVQMKKWRDVTPGSGAYLGESDIQEPDFQQAFYGAAYERLYALKQRFDPRGVFYAVTAVGSEDWEMDSSGRLCRG